MIFFIIHFISVIILLFYKLRHTFLYSLSALFTPIFIFLPHNFFHFFQLQRESEIKDKREHRPKLVFLLFTLNSCDFGSIKKLFILNTLILIPNKRCHDKYDFEFEEFICFVQLFYILIDYSTIRIYLFFYYFCSRLEIIAS